MSLKLALLLGLKAHQQRRKSSWRSAIHDKPNGSVLGQHYIASLYNYIAVRTEYRPSNYVNFTRLGRVPNTPKNSCCHFKESQEARKMGWEGSYEIQQREDSWKGWMPWKCLGTRWLEGDADGQHTEHEPATCP